MKQLPEPEGGGGVPTRYQYVDVPPPESANEPETGGLIEYWHILRRRKGTPRAPLRDRRSGTIA
jgi:hypothetical protein